MPRLPTPPALIGAFSTLTVAVALAASSGSATAATPAAAGSEPDTHRNSIAHRADPVPPAPRPTSRVVFTCIGPALVTFSDRPCGPGASVRTLHTLEPVAVASDIADSPAPGTGGQRSHGTRAATGAGKNRDERSDADALPVETTCERLQAALALVDDRMRAGYSAKESARLWDRWRDARARLRDAHC